MIKLTAVAVALLTLAGALRAQVTARPSREWLPSERTVIGDFSHITSVAAASDRVFVTSPTALLIWRPQFQRWEGPFEPIEPGLLTRVFSALVDPLDNSLWLARPEGWVHFEPDAMRWTQGDVSGAVQAIAFDLNAPFQGLYLRTGNGWMSLPRGAFIAMPTTPPARPVEPTPVSEAVRTNPTLQANSAQILLDARMRPVRFTGATRAFDRRGWYLGTWGRGVLYLSEGAALPQRLPFGLPGNLVGAVYPVPGGVWAANDQTAASDVGFTFVASDLSQFNTVQGPAATGLPFTQVRHIVGQGAALWAGTEHGVVRLDPSRGRDRVFAEGDGLPDSRVLALVSRHGMITAGTPRGIVRIDDSLRVHTVARGFSGAALGLAISGDTTWIGTPAGLLLTVGDSGEVVRPAGLTTASLQAPVVGLAWLADTLVALTPDRLLWRAPRGGWSLGPSLSVVLGPLRTLVADRGGLWVAGDNGVAFARVTSPALRPLLAGDLPGDVFDLAVDPDFLWIATSGGLVRFRLDAVRP